MIAGRLATFLLALGAATGAFAQPVPGPYVSLGAGAEFQLTGQASIGAGVRYAMFQPVAPASPAASAVEGGTGMERTFVVFFDWDSADLSPRGRQIVAEAAREKARRHAVRIEVNGYADSSGTTAYHERLSLQRALSVKAGLMQDGVSDDEIDIRDQDEPERLAQAAGGAREPQARRVEILPR